MNKKNINKAGILIEHGEAKFNFDENEKDSYYIKTSDGNGGVKLLWGIDLPRALTESGAEIGQQIDIVKANREPITVTGKIKDQEGRVIGEGDIATHRNKWKINILTPELYVEKNIAAKLYTNSDPINDNLSRGGESSMQSKEFQQNNAFQKEQAKVAESEVNIILASNRKAKQVALPNRDFADQENEMPHQKEVSHIDSIKADNLNQEADFKQKIQKETPEPIFVRQGYAIPKEIQDTYMPDLGQFYDVRSGTLQFEDHGRKLSTVLEDKKVVADMVLVASIKNWEVLELKGTDTFKRTAWLEAKLRGIDTIGYEPNKDDLTLLRKQKLEQISNEVSAAMLKRHAEPQTNEMHSTTQKQMPNEQSNNASALKVLEELLKQKQVSEKGCKEILAKFAMEIEKGCKKMPDTKIIGPCINKKNPTENTQAHSKQEVGLEIAR